MKTCAGKFAFVGLIFVLSAISAHAQHKISVRVAAETRIETDSIKLGDIALISGDGESSERMKNVRLGYAPNVGMTRELQIERIRLAVAAAGFEARDCSISAPPKIRVERAGQTISQTVLREAVEKAVAELFAGKNIAANIVRVETPANIEIPTGTVEISVNLANVRNYFSPFAAPIEIRLNNAVFRRLTATVEIEAFADVLIARRDLATNDKFDETDFTIENRRLRQSPDNYLRDASNLRGLKLIKNIRSGAEITKDSFVSAAVIKYGDAVRIVGQSGKLEISVTGEARASGKIGDRIAILNSQSKTTVQAVVVEAGLVKIVF